MRKLILCSLLVLVFAMLAIPQAQAKYDLVKWYLGVVNEDGNLITDTITVNVYTAGTTTNATIYSDEDATSKSNPWDITDGKIGFWSSATSLDIQVNTGSRGAKLAGVTPISTHTITIATQAVGVQKCIRFGLGDFIVSYDVEEAQISRITSPRLNYENYGLAVVWDDNIDSPLEVKFRIPYDYLSGGTFRAVCDTNVSDAYLDFSVYVNQDDTVWDSAATNQTPVRVTNPGSPDEVELAVTTDFASLAAGDLVTLKVWRDDTLSGTAKLELYYLEFYYNAKQ